MAGAVRNNKEQAAGGAKPPTKEALSSRFPEPTRCPPLVYAFTSRRMIKVAAFQVPPIPVLKNDYEIDHELGIIKFRGEIPLPSHGNGPLTETGVFEDQPIIGIQFTYERKDPSSSSKIIELTFPWLTIRSINKIGCVG